MNDDFGTLDLSSLIPQWQALEAAELRVTEWERRRDTGLLTARKLDHGHPAGHRGYIAAYGYISSGMEHVGALQTLMATHVTPRAPWTLLRSVFEAGFWAAWLLDPDDGPTRRRRGLQVEVQGMKQRKAFYDTALGHSSKDHAVATADHAGHFRTYRDEADKLGIKWEALNNRINVANELPKLRVVRLMEAPLQAAVAATWRSLSGMQHGYAYALVINSDGHALGARDVQGGRMQTFTINDDAFLSSAAAANHLLRTGMDLFVERCSRP